MVHAATAPVVVQTHAPVFEKGIVVGMVHHPVVALTFTLEGIIPMSHGEEGLHHVFLHVGTGVFFGLQYLEQSIILILRSHAGKHGQGIHAVVGGSGVLRMPIGASRPTDAVDGIAQRLHLAPIRTAFAFLTHQIGHVGHTLQRQHIPEVL